MIWIARSGQALIDRQRATVDQRCKRLPIEQFHDQERLTWYSPMSYTVQMFGWLNAEAARASRTRRAVCEAPKAKADSNLRRHRGRGEYRLPDTPHPCHRRRDASPPDTDQAGRQM